MPDLNGTGPRGRGPRTGRGIGKCQEPTKKAEEKNETEKKEAVYGLGRGGRPYGGGRGRRGGDGNRRGFGRNRGRWRNRESGN